MYDNNNNMNYKVQNDFDESLKKYENLSAFYLLIFKQIKLEMLNVH